MTFFPPRQFVRIVVCLITLAVCSLLSILSLAYGQVTTSITPTQSVGNLGTQVGSPATLANGKINYDITGGTRPNGGTNLFHSFGQFSMAANNIANFLNDTGLATKNILSRVTGGQPSQIFGTIQTTGFPGANLYLMNPAGVIFGPTASLNVEGSFHVTTADYLRLTDNVQFLAKPDAVRDNLLTTAPVAAFGFLSNTPAPISVQGSVLQVPSDDALPLVGPQLLSFVGGDVMIAGARVRAPAGLIQVASVGSTGEVVLGIPGLSLDPLNVSSFSRLGRTDIQLSALDVSGTPEAPVGGAILIRSGQLVMDDAALLSHTAALNGGPIYIVAPDIQMNGGLIQTAALGPGAAGDILISTGTLSLTGGALISTQSVPNPLLPGEGSGGNIVISAGSLISISGQKTGQFQLLPDLVTYLNMPGGIYSDTYSGANGGTIIIQTPQLTLQSGIVTSHTFGSGAASDITLNVGALTMRDGGQVATNSFGSGQAGIVRITAVESVDIAGHFPGESGIGPLVTNNLSSGVYAGSFVVGSGGGIQLTTPLLTMNEGHIDSTSLGGGTGGDIVLNVGKVVLTGGADISTTTFGDGSAGSLTVNATDSVTMSGQSDTAFSFGSHTFPAARPSGLISSTDALGAGGNITVQAAQLQMQEGAVISAETRGRGPAGDITLDVTNAILNGGSLVSANTFGAGQGGKVRVAAAESLMLLGETPGPVTIGGVFLSHLPSGLATVTFADGQGGQIRVSTPTLAMQKGVILAETFGAGNAGEIVVDAGKLVLTDGAQIAATSSGSSGKGGTVTVRATDSITINGNRTDVFVGAGRPVINGPSGFFTNADGTGDGGVMFVSSPILTIGDGQAGGQIAAQTFGPANAGSILVEVGSLTLANGALISGATLGAGQGGNVTVTATNSISISGRHPGSFGVGSLIFNNTQSGIVSLAFAEGKAGRISVSTANLSLHDEGLISAATGGAGAAGDVVVNSGTLSLTRGGQISSSSGVRVGDQFLFGPGPGGIITVNTGSALISDPGSGVLTSSAGDGAGGNIEFRAGSLQMTNGGVISARSAGQGNAGNISLTATDFLKLTNSFITTEALQAAGGDITIHVGSLVSLLHSRITATVLTQTGNGGNITIDPPKVILNDSQIIAKAFAGHGGKITIDTDLFLASPESVIDASSSFGLNGTVSIQSPVQNLSGTLSPLPSSLLKIAPLTSACAARAQGGSMSSFTVAGRDGVPAEPGGLLPSPLSEPARPIESEQPALGSNEPGMPIPILLAMSGPAIRTLCSSPTP